MESYYCIDSLIIHDDNSKIKFKPEEHDGFIEYKLRLDTKNKLGIKKLISQMNWRLEEGKNLLCKKEAHYLLGVNDNGSIGYLSENELNETFEILKQVIKDCDARIINTEKRVYNNSNIMYIIIQKIETNKIKEINIAFVGPSQHGKTTLIANLAYGKISSRNLILKHEHERSSGITSSIKKEIIGFSGDILVNYSTGINSCSEGIVEMSDKIINLIDLPGNTKYIRTTFFGLTTYRIDILFAVLDIDKAVDDDYEIIQFYGIYADILNIPYVILCINNSSTEYNNRILQFKSIIISEFNELLKFINSVETIKEINNENDDNIFHIIETYFIPDTNVIFSGIMSKGTLSLGQDVFLMNGKDCLMARIKCIHRKQIDSAQLYNGETGTIQLQIHNPTSTEINKHMIITTTKYLPYEKVVFKIIGALTNNFTEFRKFEQIENELQHSIIKAMYQQSLLIIENNIIPVIPTAHNDQLTLILNFQNQKVILPMLKENSDTSVAFMKNIYGVFVGYVKKYNIEDYI